MQDLSGTAFGLNGLTPFDCLFAVPPDLHSLGLTVYSLNNECASFKWHYPRKRS